MKLNYIEAQIFDAVKNSTYDNPLPVEKFLKQPDLVKKYYLKT